MQKNLPLDNTFLKTITCLDLLLVVSSSEAQLKRMFKLPQFLYTVLNEDEDRMKFMKSKYVHYPLMFISNLHWKRKVKMVKMIKMMKLMKLMKLKYIDCMKWWILLRPNLSLSWPTS